MKRNQETQEIQSKIATTDWSDITEQLHEKGYAIVPGLLSDATCLDLIANYQLPEQYRKTVIMERYRFGIGEYKYFNYPLPDVVQMIRESIYPKLVPIANTWMKVLNIDTNFPASLSELLALCQEKGQLKPTPLLLKYGKGHYNTLHQDLYGEVYFPLQTVCFLNEALDDFTGGEFVLTQQIPRAQSRAIVLQPKKGDLLIFSTNFRPLKGSKGYYRVNMKHGVSEVHSGSRHTLGIIFHDAIS